MLLPLFIMFLRSCEGAAPQGVAVPNTTEPYELQGRLGKHQDAFKALHKNGTFYSLYRSYAIDFGFGLNSSCAYASFTEEWDNKTMVFEMGYYNASVCKLYHRPTYVSVRSWPGYNTTNVFVVREKPDGFPFNYTIVFSDYETCNIIRAPHYRGGCDLWVHEEHINEPVKECCEFAYDLLCGGTKYYIYDNQTCQQESIPKQYVPLVLPSLSG